MESYDEEKLRELILYIADKCEQDTYFGATKLNKVLFFADFLAFKQLGHSITGAEYIALEHGPVPRRLLPVKEQLTNEGDIAEQQRFRQKRIVVLREPDLSKFSAEEIALVDAVIDALRHQNAETVSNLSHGFLGWKAAWAEREATDKQSVIPYSTVFVSKAPADDFEKAHAHELAKKHGWLR